MQCLEKCAHPISAVLLCVNTSVLSSVCYMHTLCKPTLKDIEFCNNAGGGGVGGHKIVKETF